MNKTHHGTVFAPMHHTRKTLLEPTLLKTFLCPLPEFGRVGH
jgi:hypothetical protein